MQNLLLNIMSLFAKKIVYADTADANLVSTAQKVTEVLNNIVGPCLSVIGSIAVVYAVVLGVQYAKSESDGKRAEVKSRVTNIIIGIIVIFIMVALCYAIKWEYIIPQMFGYFEAE